MTECENKQQTPLLDRTKTWSELYEISKDKSTSSDILHQLSLFEDSTIRESVAKHKNTSPETLHSLAKALDYTIASENWKSSIKKAIVKNPNTSSETLSYLSENSGNSWQILNSIARHEKTPVLTLKKLSESLDVVVRKAVAKNPNTPPDTLDVLSFDKSGLVRSIVAENPSTTKNTLENLSKMKSCIIQTALAKNVNTPLKELCYLLKHAENDEVKALVLTNPNLPKEVKILTEMFQVE